LDDPVGRHDGTVQGVRYFAANDNHGVFVVDSKLTKVKDSAKQSSHNRDIMMSTSLLVENSTRIKGGSFTSDENLSEINMNQAR
jgi:dynactin complex subunit